MLARAAAVLTFLLVLGPDFFARWIDAPGYLGFSSPVVLQDNLFYYNYGHQVADGVWQPVNNMSLETATQRYYYPYAYLIAAVAKFTSLPVPAAMLLIKLLACTAALWAMYRYVSWLLPEGVERELAFAMGCLSGGLGWIWTVRFWDQVLEQPDKFSALPLVHVNTFASIYLLAHFSLALALLFETLLRYQKGSYASACAFHVLLSFWHTYEVMIASAAILASLALEWLGGRRPGRGQLAGAAAVIASAAPGSVFLYWVNYSPVSKLETDNIWVMPAEWLFSFGLPMLLALVYLLYRYQRDATATLSRLVEERLHLFVAWLLVTPILVYVPFYFRRKLAAGVQFPMAVLAALALLQLAERLIPERRGPARALFVGAGALLCCLSTADLVGKDLLFIRMRVPPLFVDAESREVLDWLHANTRREEGVAASPAPLSHLVPAVSGNAVLLAWRVMVPDYDSAERAWKAFLAGGGRADRRAQFLQKYPVAWIVLPHDQASASGVEEAGRPAFRERFRNARYRIYRVER